MCVKLSEGEKHICFNTTDGYGFILKVFFKKKFFVLSKHLLSSLSTSADDFHFEPGYRWRNWMANLLFWL